ncbi:homoserine kinase [Corynebacterium caspium]|uniref:homoserine kinase n=1 Tax=Corynebacterium caspium TaxID=234828 RepID=UPI00037636C9|nr:homoserine kinase [Corynebacterium caspium]WKD59460.1 Homoserine kinase [Corynebacterium caspium DSM 44850]
MGKIVEIGTTATVKVPGSTANLGAGFDTLGLAVGIYDTVTATVTDSGLTVEIYGEGADDLPRDASHLVVKAIYAALAAAGAQVPGLAIECHNNIPQSRGLGSSAAAAVSGVFLGNALADFALDTSALIQLASAFEGHPDNAGAAVLGGGVVSWTDLVATDTETAVYHAVALPVHPDIKATALVPNFHASTQEVRRVLPTQISHLDARFNIARAALMPIALQSRPELLWEATGDKLHQPYRAEVLPISAHWVDKLRAQGYAAFLSGAGPTVMILSDAAVDPQILEEAQAAGLTVHELAVAGPPELTRQV